jgi:hypothetical protein
MTFDAFAKSIVDRFDQALPEPWRPLPDYQIAFPTERTYRGFLEHDGYAARCGPPRSSSAVPPEPLAIS